LIKGRTPRDQYGPTLGTKDCGNYPLFQRSGPDGVARGHVPQPSGMARASVVRASVQHGFAVGTESHDEWDATGMRISLADSLADLLTRGGVPELDGVVHNSGQEGFSIGREAHGKNFLLILQDRPQ